MTGTTLSQYRILEELGRGGMGIVYKAEDTKLERMVALKVLPAAALASEDDRARFYREAKAAAALNHPNIAQIYQIDEAVPEGSPTDDVRPFIAMEFIEGGTLEDRIKAGPLKLDEAVRIATQTAEALKAAHAKEIVHRDIKSANIMLTKDGQAKVLDFGLAQTNHSTKLTRMGSTLGTVAYMSPEQARGEEVDGRTDLWALGVVLYEMIAGINPFGGDYEQAVIYTILNEEPEPVTALRTGVPMELEAVVGKLLRKEARLRYPNADGVLADLAAVDLTNAASTSMSTVRSATKSRPARTSNQPPWMLAIVLVLISLAVGWMLRGGQSSDFPKVVNTDIQIPEGVGVWGPWRIAPDESFYGFPGRDSLGTGFFVRKMDEFDFVKHPLSGAWDVAISPDSRWLVRNSGDGLKRISLSGGSAESIPSQEVAGGTYVTWRDEGTLIASDATHRKLFSVPVSGGAVKELDLQDPNYIHQPYVIPGTDVLLYTSARDEDQMNRAVIMAFDLETGQKAEVARDARRARYHEDGYVVFYRNGDLLAARFDTDDLTTGDSFLLQSRIYAPDTDASYDMTPGGTLVYGRGRGGLVEGSPLSIWSAEGGYADIAIQNQEYYSPSFSPDGSRILVQIQDAEEGDDIWLVDTIRSSLQRMTRTPWETEFPVWDPDGERFYYTSHPGDTLSYLIRQRIDNDAAKDTLLTTDRHIHLISVSRQNGDLLMSVWERVDRLNWSQDEDIHVLSAGDSVSRILLNSTANEDMPSISPDGKWLAYQSGGSVYVRSYPDMGRTMLASPSEGDGPRWSADGKTLFYRKGQDLWRVPFDDGSVGAPEYYMELDIGISRIDETVYDIDLNDRVVIARRKEIQEGEAMITNVGVLLEAADPENR